MDEQIGRCVAWLEQNGLDKSTVMILVGDHGEGLGSHGEGTHGYFVYDYALHVPFLAVTPFAELRGRRVGSRSARSTSSRPCSRSRASPLRSRSRGGPSCR